MRGYSEKNEIARDRKRSGRREKQVTELTKSEKRKRKNKKIEESRRKPKVERERR